MRFLLFLAIALLLQSCGQSAQNSKANQIVNLSEAEKESFINNIIRFIGKMPDQASPKTKFHSLFDEHYEKLLKDHKLEAYYKTTDGKEYFLITRTAPSIHVKRVALGGYVVYDQNGKLQEMAEVFRTWKKTPDELLPIAELLFAKMIAGEDLSSYYPENSGNEEIIEFPNAEVFYDKEARTWVSTRENPMKELLEAKYRKLEDAMLQDSTSIPNDTIN